jgi:hypothetical protein
MAKIATTLNTQSPFGEHASCGKRPERPQAPELRSPLGNAPRHVEDLSAFAATYRGKRKFGGWLRSANLGHTAGRTN